MAENSEMTKFISAYEYGAVIGPGALLLYGVMLMAPQSASMLNSSGLTLGDLGVFVLLSFVIGHVVQAVGNVLESIIWRVSGGWPTQRILMGRAIGKSNRLSDAQRDAIRLSLARALRYDVSFGDDASWDVLSRAMYAQVSKAARAARIDSFNRTYGMLRGVTVVLLGLSIASLILGKGPPTLGVIALLASVATLIRMLRFAGSYASELIVEYVALTDPDQPGVLP